MTDNIVALIDSVPNWHVSIEQPYKEMKGRIKHGKKYRAARFTVYVANEHMFATYYYTSATVDCDDAVEGLKEAISLVHKRVKEKEEELVKQKERRK